MENNKKYILISIVLCAVLVFSLLPVSAFAYDSLGNKYDDYEYGKLCCCN